MTRRAAAVLGTGFIPLILSSKFVPKRTQTIPEDVLSEWKRSEEHRGGREQML